jgi:hypothetical protein
LPAMEIERAIKTWLKQLHAILCPVV